MAPLCLKLFCYLVVGVIFVDVAFSTHTLADPIMQPEDIRILIEQARSCWIKKDADALAQLFTPDAELIVPGQRWQGQTHIRAAIAQFTEHHTDVVIDIKQIIIEGDRAAVEWHYEDTEIATGQRQKSDDAIMVNVKAGRIHRWREFFDLKTSGNL